MIEITKEIEIICPDLEYEDICYPIFVQLDKYQIVYDKNLKNKDDD